MATGIERERAADAVSEGAGSARAPFLSVVVTTRNDNHGGDLLRRTQIFLDGLAAQANRHGVHTELVIVEWNPPADRPPLAEALRWPDAGNNFEARIVTVPYSLHSRLANSDRLPLFQMIAKNVGIRRARGKFVLATNIDLLFSDELMAFLSQGDLRSDELYRVDRYDAGADVPAEAAIVEQLAWCHQNLVRICRREGTLDLRTGAFYRIYENTRVPLWLAPWLRIGRNVDRLIWRALLWPVPRVLGFMRRRFDYFWRNPPESVVRDLLLVVGGLLVSPRTLWRSAADLRRRFAAGERRTPAARSRRFQFALLAKGRARLAYGIDVLLLVFVGERARMRLHTNACGDFTLLSRQGWFAARAYPELELFSMHIDSLFLYQAYYNGFHERFLPYRIYHLEHHEGFRPDTESLEELNDRLARAAIPQISNEQFLEWIVAMHRSKRARFRGDDSWGLAGETLSETVVVVRGQLVAPTLELSGSEVIA